MSIIQTIQYKCDICDCEIIDEIPLSFDTVMEQPSLPTGWQYLLTPQGKIIACAKHELILLTEIRKLVNKLRQNELAAS